MRTDTLMRVFGICAVLGGAARAASSFIPWTSETLWLEALAFFIDVNLLFGLAGFYLTRADRLGVLGLAAFIAAAAGIALITGPDGVHFGVDIYQAGVGVIAAGLGLLSANLLLRGVPPVSAPALWLASVLIGVGGDALGITDAAFMVSGVLFGLGFVMAGVATIKTTNNRTD